MKKKEIILLLISIVLVGTCFVLYDKSKNMTVLDEIKYNETGSVHYKVHLNDKTYYGTDYLDEGMQYISSIVDNIDLNYNYKANFDKQDKFDIITNLTATIKITDTQSGKIIYTKSETLKNNKISKDNIDVNENVVLDFKKYNELANEFKTKYGISANSKLDLNYVIQYVDNKNGINQSKLLRIEVPLSEQMINVTKSEDINNDSSIIVSTKKSIYNTILFIGAIVLLVVASICIVKFIDVVRKRIDSESKYDRFIKKTLREYDAYITISETDYKDKEKNKIIITTFKELLDVRNNLEKPIIYYKIDENNSKFSIISDEIYEYKITRKEMDK